jgi:hypothetical protein
MQAIVFPLLHHARSPSLAVPRFVAFRQSPTRCWYSPQTASPYVHSPDLRTSWLLGSCLAHGFTQSLIFHGFGLRTSPRLLGRCLHRRFCVDSLAFTAFLASFNTTIPTSDFSPFIASYLDHHGLSMTLPPTAETMRSPWVTSTDFPPNPVLLTSEVYGGIGHPLLLQGHPTSSAIMVCRLFRVLSSHPPHLSSRSKHYASTKYFRHLAVYWRLSLLSQLRCQAHKRQIRT